MTNPTSPTPERRSVLRFPYGLNTYVYSPAEGRASGEPAVVQDISTHGLGVLCGRDYPVGRLLVIELPVTTRRAPRPFLGRVVHATSQGPGSWRVGCTFLWPLSDAALQEVHEAVPPPP